MDCNDCKYNHEPTTDCDNVYSESRESWLHILTLQWRTCQSRLGWAEVGQWEGDHVALETPPPHSNPTIRWSELLRSDERKENSRWHPLNHKTSWRFFEKYWSPYLGYFVFKLQVVNMASWFAMKVSIGRFFRLLGLVLIGRAPHGSGVSKVGSHSLVWILWRILLIWKVLLL